MDALIIVPVVAMVAIAAIAVWLYAQAQGRPAPADSEAQRLGEQLVAMRTELGQTMATTQQTVSEAQRTLLQQMNSVDQKMNTRLEAVQTSVDRRLQAVQSSVSQSLTSTQETIGKIGEQLGGLDQAAKRIMEVGKDVTSLKDVLSPPKLRGAFGELLLEQLLKQVLPAAHYSTQHRFKDGTIVDVVITTPDGLVPVDSKFPIESYRRMFDATDDEDRARLRKQFIRDVRARVEEVAKYIRPDENTLDFACMYVPAEGIFYEIIAGGSEEDSMTFALERQVHLVSPNTFYALLQVVARGLARLQVQQDVKEFMARLSQVRREFARFRVEFDRLGNHIGHAKNKYDELDKWADKIDNRLAASADEPMQAPLPEPSIAPAPLGEPAQTNGHDEP